jgi:8-oxo-dGTP pyrophosphatase MutT (NUDIX family)
VREEPLGEYAIFSLTRTVRESPATGRRHGFLRLDAPDWVNVIALTGDGRTILVEQYRHGTDAVTLEIPGGAVDGHETPVKAAARELEEETGYRARELHLIGEVEPNPAFLSNRCWTFVALGCTPDGATAPDPSEEITVRLAAPAALTELIDRGTIRHALVVAAHDHFQRAIRRREPWTEGLASARTDPGRCTR